MDKCEDESLWRIRRGNIPGPRSSQLRRFETPQMTGDRCMQTRPSPSKQKDTDQA